MHPKKRLMLQMPCTRRLLHSCGSAICADLQVRMQPRKPAGPPPGAKECSFCFLPSIALKYRVTAGVHVTEAEDEAAEGSGRSALATPAPLPAPFPPLPPPPAPAPEVHHEAAGEGRACFFFPFVLLRTGCIVAGSVDRLQKEALPRGDVQG